MITIELEYNGDSKYGHGKISVDRNFFSDYRDVATVEEVEKIIMKLFNDKKANNQTVTFSTSMIDHGEARFGRITRFYSEETTIIYWDGNRMGDKEVTQKLTKKRIRDFYLEFANFALNREAEFKAREEENA